MIFKEAAGDLLCSNFSEAGIINTAVSKIKRIKTGVNHIDL